MQAEATYTAILNDEALIVRKSIPAGIDGPLFIENRPGDLAEADSVLLSHRFERAQEWQVRDSASGMVLEARLHQAMISGE